MGGFSGGGNDGSNDTDVSGAEAVTTGGTTNSEKKINKKTNQPKGNDNPEKDDTAAKLDLFYEKGATDIKDKSVGAAGSILSGPMQEGSRKNRQFFTDKVLGSKNYKDTTKEDFMNLSATKQEQMYQDYIGGRQSGDIDAYGNQIGTGRDDSSLAARTKKKSIKSVEQPKTESQMTDTKPDGTPKGPTDVEVADEDSILVRNKKKGRRKTILTDPLGVDEEVTLSNKKLLG